MPFICQVCELVFTTPGPCPHCVTSADDVVRNELHKRIEDLELVGTLAKEAKFFYPHLSHDEILVAALEELLAQNRSK